LSVVYGPGGEELPTELRWTDIVEPGKSIRVTLQDARKVEGKVVSLSPDTLAVKTTRTSVDANNDIVGGEPDLNPGSVTIEIMTIRASDDIRSIELPRFSIIKTSILLVAIAIPFVIYGMTTDGIWGGYSSPVGG